MLVRYVLGDGTIAAWFDRALTHMALVMYMKQIFDEVVGTMWGPFVQVPTWSPHLTTAADSACFTTEEQAALKMLSSTVATTVLVSPCKLDTELPLSELDEPVLSEG